MNKHLKYLEKHAEKIVFTCVIVSVLLGGTLFYLMQPA
jgi:hypothetical protein